MRTTTIRSPIDTYTILELVIKSQEKKTKEEGKKKDLQKQIQNN